MEGDQSSKSSAVTEAEQYLQPSSLRRLDSAVEKALAYASRNQEISTSSREEILNCKPGGTVRSFAKDELDGDDLILDTVRERANQNETDRKENIGRSGESIPEAHRESPPTGNGGEQSKEAIKGRAGGKGAPSGKGMRLGEAMDYAQDVEAAPLPSRLDGSRAAAAGTERPGAYAQEGNGDIERVEAIVNYSLGALSNHCRLSNGGGRESFDDSNPSLQRPSLVEAREVSHGVLLPGEAKEVNMEELERKRMQRQTQTKCIGYAIAAAILAAVLCTVLVVVMKENFNGLPSGDPSKDGMMPGAEMSSEITGSIMEESMSGLNLGEIPNYTLEALEDPFSPQSLSHHWLSNHQNLTNLPQWRQRQLFALGCMYYSLGGPQWPMGLDEDWMDDTRSECDWYSGLFGFFYIKDGIKYGEHGAPGFSCAEDGKFHTIRMATAKRFGFSYSNPSFPPEIGWLTALKYLGLENDGLTNWTSPEMFPPQFYQLTNLEFLNLGYNAAYKAIPSELGLLTKLTRLGLYGMNATGTIPTQLGLLTNMQRLDLYENQLTGTIPTELVSSYRIKLHDNLLTGTLPSELARIPKIQGLRVDGNPNLSGTIPTEFGLMTQLDGYFRIENTSLTGTIPDNFCRLGERNCTYFVPFTEEIRPCKLTVTCSPLLCGCGCECN